MRYDLYLGKIKYVGLELKCYSDYKTKERKPDSNSTRISFGYGLNNAK